MYFILLLVNVVLYRDRMQYFLTLSSMTSKISLRNESQDAYRKFSLFISAQETLYIAQDDAGRKEQPMKEMIPIIYRIIVLIPEPFNNLHSPKLYFWITFKLTSDAYCSSNERNIMSS